MNRKPWLAALLAGAVAAPLGTADGSDAAGLERASSWLNSRPLSATDLRGKVVLVDFWTYTCINWLRTLPYVRAWADKYRDHGLVVIGVHTPEFEFEKDTDNVRRAVKVMDITYPVATDNSYAVWRAFHNQAWPALYFIDAQGSVRLRHFGEGNYEAAERAIQLLLAEAGNKAVPQDLVSPEGRGIEKAADWETLKSPETYLGYEHTARFASRQGALFNFRRTYDFPKRLALNYWALLGDWKMGPQAIALSEPRGRIAYRFHARDAHIVMGAATKGSVVRFRVLLDGQPPGAAHGADVDEQGIGVATEKRLYQLIRQPDSIAERQIEIEFLDGGVEAYSFTFG